MFYTLNQLQTLEKNCSGRDFVSGDIHGHFEFLDALLKRVNFDERKDRLFVTGDIIDRGPESNQVIKWLNLPWFHTVLGNHEKMVLDAVYGEADTARHSRNGGEWFYRCSTDQQIEIAERLSLLPVAMEVRQPNGATVGIIHAESPGWEIGMSWRQGLLQLSSADEKTRTNAIKQALYGRSKINNRETSYIAGIDVLYAGHTTVQHITHLGNTIYIDTGCSFSDGKLTIIDMQTRESYSY